MSIVASLCEGISIALLIPTLNAITTGDLSTVKNLSSFQKATAFTAEYISFTDKNILIGLVSTIFLVTVMKNILTIMNNSLVAFQVRSLANNLRQQVYKRLLSFGRLFYERTSSGQIQHVLTTYIDSIAYEFRNLQQILQTLFTLVVYFAMLFLISIKLTLFVFMIFPILHFSLSRLISKLRSSSNAFAGTYSILGKKISNSINCIPLVKAYCTEDYEMRSFTTTSNSIKDQQYKIDKGMLLISPLQEIIMLIFTFTLVGIIAYVASTDGTSNIAQYGVFIIILRRASGLFGVVNQLRTSFASLNGPLVELLKVFEPQDKFCIESGPIKMSKFQKGIEFRNMEFSFPSGNKVLRDVSFEIVKGTTTAVVGQSGSGKSTIINLLMRFYDCPENSIIVDGMDIRDLSLECWMKNISLVTQEAFILNATLKDNLLYGLERDVSNEELNLVVKSAKLDELVSKLPQGLDSELGDRGQRLSGGEKQRISIARAILKKAEILILDEPTSALDSTTEKYIQETIEEAFKGKTLIVIAHRLATIKNADLILVLEKGRLVEMGKPNELIEKKDKFYAYWQAQNLTDVLSQM